MWNRLRDVTIFMGVIPLVVLGILLLAGAGFFAWGVAFLLFAFGERVVKSRTHEAAPARQEGLSLVEMDVQMKYRDKSHDLRVIN